MPVLSECTTCTATGSGSTGISAPGLTRIIREADTPEELFQIVTVHGGIFNEIHACASLVQLAKRKDLFTQKIATSTTFNDLLAFLEYQVDVMEPRALQNALWSLAQLNQKEKVEAAQLTVTIAGRAKGTMKQFQFADISNFAWSLAQLGYTDPALMQAVAQRTCQICHTFDIQAIVVVAWSFAEMKIYNEKVMEALAEEATKNISRLSSENMATLASSFTRLNQTHKGLARAITSTLLERSWKHQTRDDWFNCARILLAASRAGVVTTQFLDRICQHLDRNVLSAIGIYDVAAMLWACKKLRCASTHPRLFKMLQDAKDRRHIEWEDVEHESLLDPLKWIKRLEEKQARKS